MQVKAIPGGPESVKLYTALAAVYIGLVVLANWLASRYVIHVPLTPYLAPAGVFCIGAVLVIRDWLQQLRGFWPALLLIYVSGALSWAIGDLAGWTPLQKIAGASVIAFSVSETVEALVFTPIRRRSLSVGVGLSATVGNAVDSWIFLTLAFGSTGFFWGQFWGKSEAIAVGVALTVARRSLLKPVPTYQIPS